MFSLNLCVHGRFPFKQKDGNHRGVKTAFFSIRFKRSEVMLKIVLQIVIQIYK